MKTSLMTPQVFLIADPEQKIQSLETDLEFFKDGLMVAQVPEAPSRSAQVTEQFRGPKEKISTRIGQARLLHDLANIEMQAMELALRTYVEYPQAPPTFRSELAELAREEARHLKMCLSALRDLDIQFGHWPIHLQLWRTVDTSDSLLDRILIVHRYLEGCGLDSGCQILQRLRSCQAHAIQKVVQVIHQDEVLHVEMGSRWYRQICKDQGLDPVMDFPERMQKLHSRLPKRLDPTDLASRNSAGFTDQEILYLDHLKTQWRHQLETTKAPKSESSNRIT